MKNLALSFLAQRLDNQDPTHMELNQRPLAEGNVAERQELARQVSEVSIDGSQVFSEESHAAFLLDDKFLLETPSDQLDDAGRIAPIICYGRVPETPPVSWSSDVVKAVVEFAERIGRTVSARSQRIAGRGVDAILAETQKKSRMHVTGKALWGVGVLLIAFVYHLVKASIEIMRLKRRRKKVLRGAGILVIVLAALAMIYKILSR